MGPGRKKGRKRISPASFPPAIDFPFMILTHSLSFCRMLTSTNACWWKRFLFRIILMATSPPVR